MRGRYAGLTAWADHKAMGACEAPIFFIGILGVTTEGRGR